MEFRILGALEVLEDGRLIELGGQKQRALLAVLLVRANEVVSQDVLIDELWGENPPPTAAKTLQAHVSRLRKALRHAGVLETRGRGYILWVEPGQLDSESFRALLEDGRRAFAAGDVEKAAGEFRAALALWRGPPLSDLAAEYFAQIEIAQLEELRLAALEERIEADLALGRQGTLVPELELLVARHPLRERFLAQRMLALYRSERQAEALEAYQRGRQTLAEALGLDPSQSLQRLERQILEQDPALALPARSRRPPLIPERAWRHPRRLLLVGAVVLAAVLAVVVFQFGRGNRAIQTAGAIALDANTSEVLGSVSLGTAPSSVSIGEGSVWILDADDRTVSQIDPDNRSVQRTFSPASIPTDVVAGFGAVWVANGSEPSSLYPESVSRLDVESGEVDETIMLPRSVTGGHQYGALPGLSKQLMALTRDALWVINPDRSISRIDPRTNRFVAKISDVQAENIAASEGKVWVTEQQRIAEIDPSLNVVARRIDIPAETLSALTIGAGAVWVTDPFGGKVWRVDLEPAVVKRAVTLATWVSGIAFGEGAIWATNEITDEVYRIDPRTNAAKVVSRISAPRSVDVGGGVAWVTAASPPAKDASLPAPVCGQVFSRSPGTSPDVLLVSDLPLKGPTRAVALAMVGGIRLVLEQRDFEAGGHSVGYQSCDSATAQGGTSDFFRCALNGKSYARNLSVVAVFGSYYSYCSYAQIPIANRAPKGPLAMISPSNTDIELTTNEGLYPTGARNFFRIAAADHLQAVAHAEFVKSLGGRTIFTLTSRNDLYLGTFVENVHTAAKKLRLRVAGSAAYDPDARNFAALGRRIARARPDAVLILDILVPATGALIRDLRNALGPDVALVGPDGFKAIDDLLKLAGRGAEGMYVSNYGVPNSRLPPRGKQFLADLAAGPGNSPGPDLAAAYGAQAAEILLDAISRSDGSRASVTRELRRTRIDNGILGDIRFDRKGDLAEGPVSFFVVEGRRFVVDRVITARSSLLR